MKTCPAKGISLYPGVDGLSGKQNEFFLRVAHRHGYQLLFTSLKIPETSYSNDCISEFKPLLQLAQELGFAVIADYAPDANPELGLTGKIEHDLSKIVALGINIIRLDINFSNELIKKLLDDHPDIRLCLNASTLKTPPQLEETAEQNSSDFLNSRIVALHNYYPRPSTGLDEIFFTKQNKSFRQANIPVGAFLPAATKRGPVYKGLPTLEMHRLPKSGPIAQHLMAMNTAAIFWGDPQVSDAELSVLDNLQTDTIAFDFTPAFNADIPAAFINNTFHIRPDLARDVIRAANSRSLIKELGHGIDPLPPLARPRGTVTIDNRLAGRYEGELNITCTDLPPDPTVNVIGSISLHERFLLKYLCAGTDEPVGKFRLIQK